MVASCFERRQARWCSNGRASLSLVATLLLGLCFGSRYELFYLKEAATKVFSQPPRFSQGLQLKKDAYDLLRGLS